MAWLYNIDNQGRTKISPWTIAPVIIIGAIALGVLFHILKTQPNDEVNTPVYIPPIDDDLPEGPPVFTQSPHKIAAAFIASTDPLQRLQYVRNPNTVSSRLKLYPDEALNHPVKQLTPIGNASVQNMIFARFMASFANGNKRLICVLATENGPKVDWDAYARYGSSRWSNIIKGNSGPAEIRVFLKRGHYYAYNYSDDSIWQCYQVLSPDITETIYVYARNDSKRGELLASILPEKGNKQQRVTLTISSSKNSHQHNQFSINRIHAIGWVRAEKDIEDVWISSPLNEAEKKPKNIPKLLPPG